MDQARGSKFVIPQSNRQAKPTNLNGLSRRQDGRPRTKTPNLNSQAGGRAIGPGNRFPVLCGNLMGADHHCDAANYTAN